MINAITCSILESPSTSNDDYINTGDSKVTCFEPTIKNWGSKQDLTTGQHSMW